MLQKVTSQHNTDENGNPTGGQTLGLGIDIRWQDGPIPSCNPDDANGAFVEGVIAAAISRLQFFQDSKYKCRENACAITKLEEALHWMMHRTQMRTERGVQGKHEV